MVRWKTTENNKHAARQFGNEQEMIYMLPAFKFAGVQYFGKKLLHRDFCYAFATHCLLQYRQTIE